MPTTHGLTRHWLYPRWIGMLQRCANSNTTGWARYGGRGIRVCDRWRASFADFLADVGEPPDRTSRWSLDRINNDGDYEPGNVRWALAMEQAANKAPHRRPKFSRRELEWLHGRQHLSVSIDNLATLLLQARIARGWTQRQLAERLGLQMQKIQQYEASDYAGASLTRIVEVCQALGLSGTIEVTLVEIPASITAPAHPAGAVLATERPAPARDGRSHPQGDRTGGRVT